AKFRENHVLENPLSLLEELRAVGLEPGQIDFVVLSHLHFDHAGGCTYRDENDSLRPQFPNARYLIHRHEWEDATSASPELVGAYFEDDLEPLEAANLVDLVDDGHEVVPGVRLQLTGGHTRGHQIVHVESGDSYFAFLSDFCPTAAHLPPFWTLAYDQDHLHLRRTKPEILGKLADRDAVVIFGHDPICPAARIMRDARRGFCVREVIECGGS
ncbi:MAG: MBL fold metallo-hydrolase, partial [Planctomycetota bacterium]